MTKAIKMKRPIKVLIYGRDKQELADLTLLADAYDYVSVEGTYSDTIGTYSLAEREEFNAMLDRYIEGDIDFIVIGGESALLNHPDHLFETIKELSSCRVKAYDVITEEIKDYTEIWNALLTVAEEIQSC